MRLSKEGYGDEEAIKNMPVDDFFKHIHYENFLAEYKENFRLLNQKK